MPSSPTNRRCVVGDDIANRLMAFIESDGVLWDAVHEIQRLRRDRDRWRRTAEQLAHELGKTKYAHAVYEDNND